MFFYIVYLPKYLDQENANVVFQIIFPRFFIISPHCSFHKTFGFRSVYPPNQKLTSTVLVTKENGRPCCRLRQNIYSMASLLLKLTCLRLKLFSNLVFPFFHVLPCTEWENFWKNWEFPMLRIFTQKGYHCTLLNNVNMINTFASCSTKISYTNNSKKYYF